VTGYVLRDAGCEVRELRYGTLVSGHLSLATGRHGGRPYENDCNRSSVGRASVPALFGHRAIHEYGRHSGRPY